MRRASILFVWLAAVHGDALAAPPLPTLAPDTVADGVVLRYLHTPYGEVNGLRLADGMLVLVNPQMAPAVPDTAPVGARVRVIGQAALDGALRAVALINLDTGSSADVDGIPPPQPTPSSFGKTLAQCEAEGVVERVLHGPRGEANGVILAEGSVVYFRPDLAPPMLAPGQPFAAVGIGTRTQSVLSMEAITTGADIAAVRAAAAATVFKQLAPALIHLSE